MMELTHFLMIILIGIPLRILPETSANTGKLNDGLKRRDTKKKNWQYLTNYIHE